ncbi:MAG TPA: hypothetical protein PLL76_04850 [Thermoanaerobaculia bacterium]|nr:hypothetical protein [Thermoanaerobaculia bacterium]
MIGLTNAFGGYLAFPCVRDRVAPLLLGGRLEDYLTKEFMQFVYWMSKGQRFCEGNYGRKGEQRVDLAFMRDPKKWELDSDLPAGGRQGKVVEALIEAKYLHNRSRRGFDDNKRDEVRATLGDLARQLQLAPKQRHAGSRVALRARSVRVYGLIFVAYIRNAAEVSTESAVENRKDDFFNFVLKTAADFRLQYHDLLKPALRPVYDDHTVRLFGEDWLVSMKSALWRLKEDPSIEPTEPLRERKAGTEGS